MKTIALESIDFFQREWNCLRKHKVSDSMLRVVVNQILTTKYLEVELNGMNISRKSMELIMFDGILIQLMIFLITRRG